MLTGVTCQFGCINQAGIHGQGGRKKDEGNEMLIHNGCGAATGVHVQGPFLGLNGTVISQVPLNLNDLSSEEAQMHWDSVILHIEIICLKFGDCSL